MNGFKKIFPIFLSHYATFFAKMAEGKVVPFDEFYYQLKLMHLFQKHPVFVDFFKIKKCIQCNEVSNCSVSNLNKLINKGISSFFNRKNVYTFHPIPRPDWSFSLI
jgi:hypothetical protein